MYLTVIPIFTNVIRILKEMLKIFIPLLIIVFMTGSVLYLLSYVVNPTDEILLTWTRYLFTGFNNGMLFEPSIISQHFVTVLTAVVLIFTFQNFVVA